MVPVGAAHVTSWTPASPHEKVFLLLFLKKKQSLPFFSHRIPMTKDTQKRLAAEQAASLVEDGMVVGLGTGSTATFFIDSLIARARDGLRIVCIPTSERSAAQARAGGLQLVDFGTHPVIDLTIDGADEIKRDTLDLVKGLGGALLREKIVASASRRLVIIADTSKLVDWLGTTAPVPVEVTRFGWEATREKLRATGAGITQRMAADGQPYVTDGGNFILDLKFEAIADAAKLNDQIRRVTGVVETGLFVGMAEMALVADEAGVTRFHPA
jgi:ribose 5-phosphate isomerase A